MTTTAHEHAREARPLLGLRRQPGRLVLAVMRVPRPLYTAAGVGCSTTPSF